ncbi:hypothetical protein BDW74DRAFT_181800 [Aspergillus multicolor]|uniref:uncharacterized protein n=1 Tax=Aspergillus multicolor TaxID=41759 RepID=UPI003CCCE427
MPPVELSHFRKVSVVVRSSRMLTYGDVIHSRTRIPVNANIPLRQIVQLNKNHLSPRELPIVGDYARDAYQCIKVSMRECGVPRKIRGQVVESFKDNLCAERRNDDLEPQQRIYENYLRSCLPPVFPNGPGMTIEMAAFAIVIYALRSKMFHRERPFRGRSDEQITQDDIRELEIHFLGYKSHGETLVGGMNMRAELKFWKMQGLSRIARKQRAAGSTSR